MILDFSAPNLRSAAPHLYEQRDFWRSPPNPESTAIDLLSGALSEISLENLDSDAFDQGVLRDVERFKSVFDAEDTRLTFPGLSMPGEGIEVSGSIVRIVRSLSRATPRPHAVRVVGKLDMIRSSTQGFAIQLDDGTEVSGVYESGEVAELQSLFNCRVLVNGTVVYKPSGKPLRIDAVRVSLAGEQSSLWAKLPPPADRAVLRSRIRRGQTSKTGVSAMVGRWPGDETNEEIESKLAILS